MLDCRALRRYCLPSLVLSLALLDPVASAQTIQQDRRIEEQKREDLRASVAAPPVPATQPPSARAAPPVPPPIEELYFANLAQKRIAYHYDAVKSLVIFLGVDEEYLDLASQVVYLRTRGIVPPRLRDAFDPMAPLRRGVAAYMFCQALGIRGGIARHLFSGSERYALKELAFQGIMSPGHMNDLISGVELVQVMNQAAQYQLRRQTRQR